MARQARSPSSTGYYHIIVRGNNREPIFSKKTSKKKYMSLFHEYTKENSISIVAWCIMDNHGHFILKSDLNNLKNTMSSVNTKFAMTYNYLNDRVGHVFQNRYRIENIEYDEYLMNVIRYVHNNPVKANIVSDISDYEWSSYNEYLYQLRYICKEQKHFILSYFNDDINRLINFHELEDENTYLDTKEDKELFKLNHGQKVLHIFAKPEE